MIENVGRKLVLIGALLGAALLLLLIPDRPIRMGLDIAGGTRLVYRFDLEGARAQGQIGPNETDEEVISQTIEIIRERVDPDGVREPVIRRAGSDRIEIQLPGGVDLQSSVAPLSLAQDVTAAGAGVILLSGEPAELAGFPGGGGTIRIGAEDIRYDERVGAELRGIERGAEGTTPAAHSTDEEVALVSDDSIKNAIENLGDLRFYPVAVDTDFSARGADRTAEDAKLRAWLERPENAAAPIAAFNAISAPDGGAADGIEWFPMRGTEQTAAMTPLERFEAGLFLPMAETPEEWTFTGADLDRVFRTQDQFGTPAVGFEMGASARIAFGDFTGEYKGRRVAIVLNDEVVTAPNIEQPLYGQSQISGQFTDREVAEMVTVLRSGSLLVKPVLDEQEKVGATLGEQYVRRGLLGGLVALGLTFLFMAFYYRKLGLFACAALAANLILLMGVMVVLQATLTLPGIAGIILTVGMAVDANILIFDRIREEGEKGRKPIQAAKDGFANALSAIIDANVTTFLTAAILKYVGTGPVRGFATTLMIGIATSMFAALVITRVLVHLQIEKGVERWSMARWLADAKYDFMKFAKPALTMSAIAVVAGTALFLVIPDQDKLGIDFTGGARVKIRTEDALSVDEVRERVAGIPGSIGQTAEVAALPVSRDGDGYREFAITFKTSPSQEGTDSASATIFSSEVRLALGDIIQRGPIYTNVVDGAAELDLYFEDDHRPEEVQEQLAGIGLTDLAVAKRGDQGNVFTVTGTAQPGVEGSTLRALAQRAFAGEKDSSGQPFTFAEPMPEASVIGAQVVGELRDSAIRAILISIFLVVMYIRVRFAEYSYGFAAVAAVVHDVLITLGAVAVMVKLPFVQVEMNLTLIAAFLTILGYSLNDTIVIFDRVRENLPRVKGSLSEVVNLSINQTLSRTIVTTITTLLSVIVVLCFNFGTGNALEGFMLALAVGILSGTYSTIFIACPLLVWFENRAQGGKAGAAAVEPAAKAAVTQG